jgi:hypothetical protein
VQWKRHGLGLKIDLVRRRTSPSAKKRETQMIFITLLLVVIAPIVIAVRAGGLKDEYTAI